MKLSWYKALSYLGNVMKMGGGLMLYSADKDERALADTLSSELYSMLNEILKGKVKRRISRLHVREAAEALATAVKDATD